MTTPHITADHLFASYGSGGRVVPVLHDVCFAVERGETVALMGPSGSGKTTLLSLVGGLSVVEQGTLRVDGHDLHGLSRSQLAAYRREHVGFVFQFFNLLPTLNVRENVEAGLEPLGLPRREWDQRVDAALAAVGLTRLGDRYPHELSGGERQLVAIARAWSKAPPLLLADEPTGNLDAAAGERLMDLLLTGPQEPDERTLVIATHDPRVAERADRVLRLERGQVVG